MSKMIFVFAVDCAETYQRREQKESHELMITHAECVQLFVIGSEKEQKKK